ncbi:DUF2690 domain-containing protein [Streptomyces mirabilis]|uniref:DUF2690 domain-containing protein n=1 Tax=Streptomyces mirabilis TaxID=68239 RepID=UPI0038184756
MLALTGLTTAGTANAETSGGIVPLSTCTFDSPITPHSTTAGNATVQLRYSTTTRCAWGRITNAQVGDQVWVDRSYDGGGTYEHLGGTYVNSGSDTHTPSYYDGGLLMRACGHSGGITRCTSWY